MSGREELIKSLSTAPENGVGNNVRDGKYRFAVKKMGFINGVKGTRFQATLTVVNSMPINSVWLKTEKGHNENEPVNAIPNQVASDIDFLCTKLKEVKSVGPGNLRRFIRELFSATEIDDTEYEETLLESTDPELASEVKGMLIDAETSRLVTAEKKVEIVTLKWSHVDPKSYDRNAYAAWVDQCAAAAAPQQLQTGAAA